MARVRSASKTLPPPPPRVRRAYFDCRFGQLHMHYAMPGGGGFEEADALLCLPGQPGSGRYFQTLLAPLGRDRSVYAPDLPGCGESDGPAGAISAAELALGLLDFLDSMRIRRISVLAHAQGVAVAAALDAARAGLLQHLIASPDTPSLREGVRAVRCSVHLLDLGGDSAAPNAVAAAGLSAEILTVLGVP